MKLLASLTFAFLVFACIQVPANAQSSGKASQIIYLVRTTPVIVAPDMSTPVLVTAKLAVDPTLLRDSVSLLRYDASDKFVGTYGAMYDDGTHGDQIGGDNTFSRQIIVNETHPGALVLRVSAAYQGELRRVTQHAMLFIQQARAPEETLRLAADALEAGDIATARQYFAATPANDELLSKLSAPGRGVFADGLRTAAPISGNEYLRTYSFNLHNVDGSELEGSLTMTLSKTGWIIEN